jgi:ABC-type transport system involved in multi-copper enzyme maturation permease subunit
MSRHVVAALFEDAFRQVLDDKVFRLLVGLALVLILPTFLVGIRPDGVSLLFGWKTWTYEEVMRSFGGAMPHVEDVHVLVVRGVQEAIVQGLAGTVGLLFCIAATAFFVPRMLEKGAADTLFSKPVGRFALLLARYCAGVMFVAILSFLLVLGMHIGFRVVSGYSDPAFLWSALTLTYAFALVHSVSVAVAVLTRSSIAAILSTLMFFVFTGCIHQAWIQTEHAQAVRSEAESRGEEEATSERRFGFLIDALDTAHWILPKTTDADYVTAGMRRSMTEVEPRLRDTNGLLSIVGDPSGFVREGPSSADLEAEPALWIARDAAGEETARLTLSRRNRADPERKGKLRAAGSFASEFAREIEKDPTTAEKPVRSGSRDGREIAVSWVRWRVRGTGADVDRARGFSAVESELYVTDAAFQPAFGTAEERERALNDLIAEVRLERKSAVNQPAPAWYGQQFGWTSPWRYNAFVSIGTSLLFALALLLFARWRLARIDF